MRRGLLAGAILLLGFIPSAHAEILPDRSPFHSGMIPCQLTPGVSHACLVTGVTGPVQEGTARRGSREGRACAYNVLRLVAVGDTRIRTAIARGRIQEVSSVDYQTFGLIPYWGVFTVHCTVVKGR